MYNTQTLKLIDGTLEFTMPKHDKELSIGLCKVLDDELDQIFVQYKVKYGEGFDIMNSCHNGIAVGAHYHENGMATPGVPADGFNKFLVAYEHWRGDAETPNPGHINVYVYHPEQRDVYGDHFFPTGMVLPNSSEPYDFGADFVKRNDFVPELGKWYTYGIFIRANTPGERDGRITCFVDGDVIMDFGNLRFRDTGEIKIDRIDFGFHCKSNPKNEAKIWYDDFLIATML
jgi:hypothetical protein